MLTNFYFLKDFRKFMKIFTFYNSYKVLQKLQTRKNSLLVEQNLLEDK